MKSIIIIALLILGVGTAKAQYTITQIIKLDSGYVTPEISSINNVNVQLVGVDTVRATIYMGRIKTSTGVIHQGGTVSWENGYYVRSKNAYLDRYKKRISSLFRVFKADWGGW